MATSRIIELRNQGEIHLFEGSNGAEKVVLKAPASLTADRTIVLPAGAPIAGQFIQSDASGNWTYATGTSTLQSAYDNGATITIGAGGPVILNDADGGEVLRVSATTSGNPFLVVKAATGELRATQINAGAGQIGTFSAHNLEVLTNNVARMVILSTGEVGIGGTPEAGVKLDIVGGPILLDNAQFLQGENIAGANRNLIGMDASDQVVIANSGDLLVIAATRTLIPSSAAATAKVSINGVGSEPAVLVTKGSLPQFGIEVDQNTDQPGIYIKKTVGSTMAFLSDHLVDDAVTMTGRANNGAASNFKIKVIDTGSLTGLTSKTLTGAVPIGAIVLAVTVRSIVTVTTSDGTAIKVGTVAVDNRYFSISSPFNAGNGGKSVEDSASADTSAAIYKVATDIVLKPTGAAATFTAGQIRVAVHYFTVDFPTS